ncbi:MAG: amidophosphoribosyltransferase, partial [Kangiellaceae bacterium]|nr:amidophosphoribosyltransferase [Kangiellaceae bacterium]
EKEVEEIIGADKLIYQDLEDLVDTCREGNPKIKRFDTSVFDGKYITGDIDEAYLEALDNKRNDAAKKNGGVEKIEDESDNDDNIMELHNVGGA